MTYTVCGEKTDRVVYGMEYAGGAFYTVEGTKLNHNADDGFRELRMQECRIYWPKRCVLTDRRCS